MASVNLKKIDLLEILKKNKLVVSNEAVQELAKLIEETLGITLVSPITEYLNYEIRNRLTSLKTSWSNLKTSQNEQRFLNEIAEQTCKFQIRNIDIQQDSLMVKYQAANQTETKLKSTVEQMAHEIHELKKKLKRNHTVASMTAAAAAASQIATPVVASTQLSTSTVANSAASVIYVTQQGFISPQAGLPQIIQTPLIQPIQAPSPTPILTQSSQILQSPLAVNPVKTVAVESPKTFIQPCERVDLGSKNTIKKILLQKCYDQMDSKQASTSLTTSPSPPSPAPPKLIAQPPLETFTIKPSASAPILFTSKKINQIAPVKPATPAPSVIVKTPLVQSVVSTTTLPAPLPANSAQQNNLNTVRVSDSTVVDTAKKPENIAPKPNTEPKVNIRLNTVEIDLTKATTEFIIEQKKQIQALAKQKSEVEKKIKLCNNPPFFSKIMKSCKRKNFFNVSKRQQRRLKIQIKESILESTKFLRNMGLCVNVIELSPVEYETDNFNLNISSSSPEATNDHSGPTVNNILYVKDKWSISDRAYNAFRLKCHINIPSLFNIKKRRNEIDSMFGIRDNEMGVFMSLKEKFRFCLKRFFDRKYGPDDVNDPAKFKDNIIHVKLGADGTNIGRNLKLLNFTFTIINEGVKAKQATGNYTLGIFEIQNENYAAAQVCFKEIVEELQELKQVKVGKNTVQLVYYFAADWKMLAHLLGIQSANSKYPCIWCKCNKEEFYDLEKEWSITDSNMGCRTHEEHAAILNHEDKKKIIMYGYDKQPIFKDIIPISRYMIDMLHLFLRISDTLFNLLVKDCSLADNFDASAISKFDVSKYKHMNSLQHFLNEKCNVRFTFLWVAETKKLDWRDLVGPEKIKLFDNFNLAEIIPDHEKFALVEKVWSEFYELVTLVKQCGIEASELKERSAAWLRTFLQVYNKTTVTPYMHAFVQHLHEFVRLYRDINAFNCQGLEKLNDMTTGQYFKGTNKHETALHQILKKRNRIEYLCAFVEEEKDDES